MTTGQVGAAAARAHVPMPDVLIIVVGTSEKNYVLQCLRSIRASKTHFRNKCVVVDNASTDGTAEAVAAEFPDTVLIQNTHKEGYIQNNNRVIRDTRSRYVLMLNADVELQSDTLQTMTEFMDRHPSAAVSACKLVYADGRLQLTCRRFPTPWTYLHRLTYFFRLRRREQGEGETPAVRRYLMLDYDHATAREVDWVLTAFFLMRRCALEEIGLLDERMFRPFYLEDVDWCFRARCRGWRAYYVPEVCAMHHYQRDSARSFNRLTLVHILNILYFFRKHGLAMLLQRHCRDGGGT